MTVEYINSLLINADSLKYTVEFTNKETIKLYNKESH